MCHLAVDHRLLVAVVMWSYVSVLVLVAATSLVVVMCWCVLVVWVISRTLVVHCHAVVVLVMVPEVMSACKLVLDHRMLVAAYR